MPVAVRPLPVHEEPLRHDEVQVILGPRHRDIEEPPLLLDFRTRAGGEVGRQAAVDGVEDEDRLPLLPFRRVDGGKDQVVLIEQRLAGPVAGGVRRIERQLGQEPLAARIGRGDLHKLEEIGFAQ